MTSAAKLYRDLYAQLVFLIEQGLEDSQAADDLRDRMDGPWWEMLPEEHIAFNQESPRCTPSIA